jgi:hypothetical protein
VLTNQGTIRSVVTAPNTEVARIKGWNSGGGNPTINNDASGVFEIEGDGVPFTHTQYSAMAFNNEGRIVKTAGTGTLLWNSYWTLDNATGAIIESAVGAGTIQFAAEVSTTFRNGSILRGPGAIRLTRGVINGPAGTWTVDASGALIIAGSTVQAPQTGSLTLAPNTGSLKWLSGIIHGNLTIPAGATLDVDGDVEDKNLGADSKPAILDNFGTIRFFVASGKTAVARIRGWNSGGGNPTVNNKPSGVLRIEGNGAPLGNVQYSAMAFKNEGRIVKISGGGASELGGYWSLDNVAGGILECQDPAGTIQLAGKVPLTFRNGTVLRGPGKFRHTEGDLVGPAGTWTIEGAGEFLVDGGVLSLPQTGSVAIAAPAGTALQWISGIIHGNLTIPSGSTLSIEGAYDN